MTYAGRFARAGLVVLTIGSTAAATWLFFRTVSTGGLNVAEMVIVPLFAVLFGWIAFSFWTATLGLFEVLAQPKDGLTTLPKSDTHEATDRPRPRTAILMPIYNESPTSVFAGIRAMIASLAETGKADGFDFYILSDTTKPDVWLEEERAWARLTADESLACRVFYRHRPKNVARKSGNIADFCERWGAQYECMIVLDADSVMAGATLVEMVRRMEADPQLGILQVPPTPVGRVSLFARLQQFASRLYGPIYIQGFATWAKFDGNYWGHNAIIRVAPFLEHCDLPKLPGKAPLGGEILSHDFVEAALMARAGWKVALAQDLGGSYEECPTTLLDYAMRDQRWCQGNMQHIRLVISEGFRPISRIHMAMGVMSYLSSPLWLMFILLSALGMSIDYLFGTAEMPWNYGAGLVFGLTMALLILPKMFGLIALARVRGLASAYGGWMSTFASVVAETLFSVLMAPLMMCFHTQFVVATFLGRKVAWNAQNRNEGGTSLIDAVTLYWPQTLLGWTIGTIVYLVAPELLIWFSPIVVGLGLAIPLTMMLDSARVGRVLARLGLLLIPEETSAPELLRDRAEALVLEQQAAETYPSASLFPAVLYDPGFHALHVRILQATDSHRPAAKADLARATQTLQNSGVSALTVEEKRMLLSDADALRDLHVWMRSQPMGLLQPFAA